MLKKIFLTFLVLASASMIAKSNTWTQKMSMAQGRNDCVGFAIGAKGYVGTGNNGSATKEFWEFNPATNTWTQKADFGGAARVYATGFAIGNKGYIGTGRSENGSTVYNDFWEYNPVTNTWTAKSNFPGGARYYASGMSIGDKGYIGIGYNGTTYKQDFYEYNPATNIWRVRANYPVVAYGLPTFSVTGNGYMGGGNGSFYKYDPTANTWTNIASFANCGNRVFSAGFAIGNKGYIGCGTTGSYKQDFWEYNPTTNSWVQKLDFPGGAIIFPVAFGIGSKGYIATGWTGSSRRNTIYEYTPSETSITGYLWAWGNNSQGQLGNGTTTNASTPTLIGGGNYKDITANYETSAGITSGNSLYLWGNNYYGSLCSSYINNFFVPSNHVSGTWKSIVLTEAGYSYAIKTDGTLWYWGKNQSGTRDNVPKQFGTDSDWAKLATYYGYFHAIKTNGTRWAWGENFGVLGDGTRDRRDTPVQIGTDAWQDIAAGREWSLALKSDGSIWETRIAGNPVNYPNAPLIPVQVGTSYDWVKVFAGHQNSFAIKSDGTLWGWGENGGRLGDGTTTPNTRLNPVRIGSATDKWVSVVNGWEVSFGVKADGTLWAWGSNYNGEFGNGNTTSSYVPVRVGIKSDWIKVALRLGHVIGLAGNSLNKLSSEDDGLLNETATSDITLNVLPNPINESGTIKFDVPVSEHYIVELYSMTGMKVATLFDGSCPAGINTVRLNSQNLTAGIYTVVLKSGTYQTTTKVVIVK